LLQVEYLKIKILYLAIAEKGDYDTAFAAIRF